MELINHGSDYRALALPTGAPGGHDKVSWARPRVLASRVARQKANQKLATKKTRQVEPAASCVPVAGARALSPRFESQLDGAVCLFYL